jgi:hypothetical protein
MKIPESLLLSLLLTAAVSAQTNTFPASGNVGIGTTSPSEKLQVAGNISVLTASGYRYDVIGSVEVPTWNFAARPAGWYRIATNSGGRASATFELRENADHSNITFMVACSFNNVYGTSVTMLNHNYWDSTTFKKLRVLTKGTYDPQYIEVYVDPHNNDNCPFFALMKGNLENNGWALDGFDPGAIPSGYHSSEYNIDDLFVAAGGSDVQSFRVDRSGNVGVGTATPKSRLSVSAGYSYPIPTVALNANGTAMGFNDIGGTHYNWIIGAQWNVSDAFEITPSTAVDGESFSTPAFVVQANGRVGIGTINPTQKLSVNGTVRAKEVIVDSGWSDFVFDESYKLKALSETEAFIKAEKHLPGIPSAKDVAEHGVSVGEMQARLLAKIEELTLHQIEEEKRISRLEAENRNLRMKIESDRMP